MLIGRVLSPLDGIRLALIHRTSHTQHQTSRRTQVSTVNIKDHLAAKEPELLQTKKESKESVYLDLDSSGHQTPNSKWMPVLLRVWWMCK